jgi:hypothetical protein
MTRLGRAPSPGTDRAARPLGAWVGHRRCPMDDRERQELLDLLREMMRHDPPPPIDDAARKRAGEVIAKAVRKAQSDYEVLRPDIISRRE